MKTILQIKGDPTEIVKYCCKGILMNKDFHLSFSRIKITDDSVYITFTEGNKPHLLALLDLKDQFEIRRIDPLQTTVYYKNYALMVETPPRISNHLRKKVKAA